jgi:hypothetical protein
MANKQQLTRDYIMTYISDFYKDVNGIRPRGYNFNAFTDAELIEFWNDLEEQLEENNKEEEIAAKESIVAMELSIKQLINNGAATEATALRWLLTGYCQDYLNDNNYITGYDIDGFLYNYGLSPYNDYGKGLREKLLTIARQLYGQYEAVQHLKLNSDKNKYHEQEKV